MFVKLFSSILDSSIWAEDDATVRVWITMLAMCDRNGMVWASSSGIAARARKTPEETRAALALLSAPDPDSRTLAHEGRRVERVDGGYLVLNYAKYRETRDAEERRLQTVAAVRRHRANKDKRAAAGKPCKPNHGKTAVRGAPLPRMVPSAPAVPRQFYVTRNAILASLGYPTYTEYLASDRWAGIRRSVLKRDKRLCRLCGGAATEVHHASYSRAALLGRDTTHLYSVCRECHEWVEFRPGHRGEPQRRSPKEMVAETHRLLRARLETPIDEAAAPVDLNAEAAARISREE